MEGLMPDGSIIAIPKKEVMAAIVAKTRGHAPEKPGKTENPAEATSRQAQRNAAIEAQQRVGISFTPKKEPILLSSSPTLGKKPLTSPLLY